MKSIICLKNLRELLKFHKLFIDKSPVPESKEYEY
jgi:hypothetical protein